ncbi:hypothetical protein MRB53_011001 [Persea americana]|uniref:Uncharacterized protein n=1 Tax=Persea americana TaxID=3435 RepID=A0ACC2LUM0_PERAE|nr:hypothetical protein MRB53_011001 [Persea americana]
MASCCLFFFLSGGMDFRPKPLSQQRAPVATGDSSGGRQFWAVAWRAARSAVVVVLPDLLSLFSSQFPQYDSGRWRG